MWKATEISPLKLKLSTERQTEVPTYFSWLCSACNKDLHLEAESIGCSGNNCNRWYHPSCVMSDKRYAKLTTDPNSKWYCPECTPDHQDKLLQIQHLPKFQPSASTNDFVSQKWGLLSDIKDKLERAYLKIVTWKRNLFKLPSGPSGKSYIAELQRLIDLWVNKTPLESVALLAQSVFGPIMLQKPSRTSKNRDHIKYLTERLNKWKNGQFDILVSECEAIQSRLIHSERKSEHVEKVFVRLMLQGKVSAALRWITNNNSNLLDIDSDVIDKLKLKHPEAASIDPETLISGEIPTFEPVIFENIDGMAIAKAAKVTKGSSGPTGLDSDMWRRILCSKSFNNYSANLCDSLAKMARRLCTEYVDPSSICTLLNCRLIPLDKNPGIRPIGIGEVLRRIIGKSVITFLKPEIIESVGPLQLSAGQEGGCEAACHAMREMFDDDDSEGVLLVDASNAFNSLNRKTALLNIRHLCPTLSIYLINTYRQACKLFLPNGSFLLSNEGTTQGDNCSSGFYSISTFLLIKQLADIKGCSQLWYADDAGAVGKLIALKLWWDKLLEIGPPLGYFPNASKTWLVVKPEYLQDAKDIFHGTNIRITEEGPEDDDPKSGQRYLGSALGTEAFQKQYVNDKVTMWINELEVLCDIAKIEPQLAYAAYTFGLSKRWIYVMRTIPNISEYLKPLEDCIRTKFIPTITGAYQFNDLDRDIYSLPTKHGGLGIFNPAKISDLEYKYSISATKPLVNIIKQQNITLSPELNIEIMTEIKKAKSSITSQKTCYHVNKLKLLKQECTPQAAKSLDILCEKGSSSWLTALPLKEFGFILNKQEFVDAVLLRYNHPLQGIPKVCACSKPNSVDHSLICKRGGFVSLRHNQIRDLEAHWLTEVCKDVQTEPKLLPLTGESFRYKTANTAPDARLDIVARGLWSSMERTFFDVRVFHHGALSNNCGPIEKAYQKHEMEKKRTYNARIIEVEKSSFTPLVFSTAGGMGEEGNKYHKRLASLLANKRGNSYSDTAAYIRRKLRFSILRTTLMAVRGYRGTMVRKDHANSDINLIPYENQHY